MRKKARSGIWAQRLVWNKYWDPGDRLSTRQGTNEAHRQAIYSLCCSGRSTPVRSSPHPHNSCFWRITWGEDMRVCEAVHGVWILFFWEVMTQKVLSFISQEMVVRKSEDPGMELHRSRIKSTLVGPLAKIPLAKAPDPRRTAVPLSMASQWSGTESVIAM